MIRFEEDVKEEEGQQDILRREKVLKDDFGPDRVLSVWEDRNVDTVKDLHEEAMNEVELVTRSQLILSQIVRRAGIYLSCIDHAVAKGNSKVAYDMLRLIFALVPRETREQLIALTPDQARSIVQTALKAIDSGSTPTFTSKLKTKP